MVAGVRRDIFVWDWNKAQLLRFAQYIHEDSKLLGPVICFAELVLTGLWAVWANVPKLKSS